MKTLFILTAMFWSLLADAQDTLSYKFFEVTSGEKVVICPRPNFVSPSALMITNGGMFDPDYGPHGLLICDGKLYKKLDLRAAKKRLRTPMSEVAWAFCRMGIRCLSSLMG